MSKNGSETGKTAGKEILRTERLVKNYGKEGESEQAESAVKVLRGLDLCIREQEFAGIMGKSGCGKTTLLKVLGLIDKPTGGKVYFYRKSIADLWSDELADIRRQKIGFIFQDFYLLNSMTVRENIMLPMVLDKRESRSCTEKGEELAEKFGLTHLLEKYPYELSGGEKQRTAISRALINNPDLILADEPTGNLDSRSSQNVIDTLCQINRNMGKTIIMVTHDPRMASYCSRLILLKDGVILEDIERKEEQERFYQKILEKM